jgi:hypothetical protein
MPIEEQIKIAADKFWGETEKRSGLVGRSYLSPMRAKDQFSPDNLWAVERLFESAEEHGENQFGGLIDSSTLDRRKFSIFDAGSYIGEIVRHFHGEKCKWVDADAGDEIELHLPDGKILSPMKFVKEQFTAYKPESFIAWGKNEAMMKIGTRPKQWIAKFGNLNVINPPRR